MNEHLGDRIEDAYRTIYAGGGADFGLSVVELIAAFEKMVDLGLIANVTAKRIEIFLSGNMCLPNIQVISSCTNNVVLLDTETHEKDTFDLRELIIWITENLCDHIMRKNLCGRNTYEGIKNVLESYVDKEHRFVKDESWIDFYSCENRVFYTRRTGEKIHLYVREECVDDLPFPGRDKNYKDVRIVKESLLDGKIYYLSGGTVFVETSCGYIAKIKYVEGERHRYSKIKGLIIDQSEGKRLFFVDACKLVQLKSNGRKTVLVNNALPIMTSISENRIFWKSCVRKKDFDATSEFNGMTYDQIVHCLDTDCVSKEILWKGLLFTLYDFDYMEFDNKIGNRLRFANIFDKLPIPFTMSEIGKRLSAIEELCYDGNIVKTEGYIEAMSYLFAVENNQLDEKLTINALSYLLDNVTQNPYEKIRCWSETRVINCFDYIFRNMDKKIAREKMKMMKNDVSGDEFFKKLNEIIDLRIAEFERLDKEHHKKNEKKGKGDKDKRKISQEDNVEDT